MNQTYPASTTNTAMKTFDDILKVTGQFGSYQRRLYSSFCYLGFLTSAAITLNNFLLGVPEHRCKLPGYDNDTFDIQSDVHRDLVNSFIPDDDGDLHPYDRCNVFVAAVNKSSGNLTKTTTCSEWVYDTSVFTTTFAKELDMVCDNAFMIPNAQMIMFFGVLSGSLAFGQISDMIGRRKTQYLGIWMLILSTGCLIPMTEYIGVCFLLFFLGAAILGLYMTTYVLCMEFVGPSKRRVAGTVIHFFNMFGNMYCLLMVYLLRSWRYFTAAIAAPMCILLTFYWFVPESCRWLLSRNRKDEAIEVMKSIAKVNKRDLPEKDFDELEPPRKTERIWLLFSNKAVAARTLILFYNWFVCSMAYYGFIWNVGNLGGSYYLNFLLTLSVDIPSDTFSYFFLRRFGRRTLHMFYMFVGGAFCIGTLWPILDGSDALHPVLIGFALVGQFSVVGAFLTVYILSSELYPTVVRNGGMGASSAVARIGSMISPYIAKLADVIGGTKGKAIPLTVFGIAMVIAGILTYFLPETKNKPMPETIEDAKDLKKFHSQSVNVHEAHFKNEGFDQAES